jgi:serine/threonine-protein kinase
VGVQGYVLNGRYQLDRIIGEGGMAVVYHGQDLLLNREVAIKILRDHFATDEGFLRRFEREGQIAAGMSHPNIVNVYDVGHDGEFHYIVMENVRGPNLKELIYKHGPFSVDGAVFIIGQVAAALDYAHQRGLVHRDVKPQNILVNREGNAKVVDFGIAKGMRDANLTEAGTGMGTVHYVSPEQARGESVGPASDLYSTGVVLFEMLTKALPFDADTPVAIAMKHVQAPPPRPSSLNAAIPPQIDAIVTRALAKDPAARYASGAALETALRHWDDPHFQPLILPQAIQTRVPIAGESVAVPTSSHPPPARPSTQPQLAGRRPPPPRRQQRSANEVGCVTWIIGSLLLVGIVGAVVATLQWGPALFEAAPAQPAGPSATPTEQAAAVPTETPEAGPAATSTTEPQPTATVTPEVTPTTAEPTATGTATTTPEPTMTPTLAALPVPDVRNATVSQARIAVGVNWTLDVQEEYSDDIDEGIIIRQEPAPGSELAQGESIIVWVSLGSSTIAIPSVIGMSPEAARAELEALDFVVVIESEPSTDTEAGLIGRTDPSGSAERGATITLFQSLGDVVAIPDVYAIAVIDASAMLSDAGLTVRNVTPQTCATIQRSDPEFDCSDFPAGAVVFARTTDGLVNAWWQYVPRGTVLDLVYYQPSNTP